MLDVPVHTLWLGMQTPSNRTVAVNCFLWEAFWHSSPGNAACKTALQWEFNATQIKS